MARPTIPITSTQLSKNDWQARKTPGCRASARATGRSCRITQRRFSNKPKCSTLVVAQSRRRRNMRVSKKLSPAPWNSAICWSKSHRATMALARSSFTARSSSGLPSKSIELLPRRSTKLDVGEGSIVIENKGAFDCMIRARVQTAVLRGCGTEELEWEKLYETAW